MDFNDPVCTYVYVCVRKVRNVIRRGRRRRRRRRPLKTREARQWRSSASPWVRRISCIAKGSLDSPESILGFLEEEVGERI